MEQKKITSVMLAKDILKWLKPGSKIKIKPRFNFWYVASPEDCQESDLQRVLKSGKACEVCGLGGFIAALAYRQDGIKFESLENSCEVAADEGKCSIEVGGSFQDVPGLRGIFDYDTLLRIEQAFEKGAGIPSRITTARGRLRWIAQNIIDHRGKFVVEEK